MKKGNLSATMNFLARGCCALFTASVMSLGADSQSGPKVIWNQSFGGAGFDALSSVVSTHDDGFVAVGYTDSFGQGNSDVWLIKTDSNGKVLWEKTFGGTQRDRGYTVIRTQDGGYAVLGETSSFGSGDDVWMIKTDAYGTTLWEQTFPVNVSGYRLGGEYVVETADGDFVFVGGSLGRVLIVRADSMGNTIWQKFQKVGENPSEESSNYLEPYLLIRTSDGGYFITGQLSSGGGSVPHLLLMKVGGQGDMLWNRAYSFYGYGYSAAGLASGGYLICTARGTQNRLLRVDSVGDQTGLTTFGADNAYSIAAALDGGYLIGGSQGGEGWLQKTDANGKFQSKMEIGGTGSDIVFSVVPDRDGNVVAAGFTDPTGSGEIDGWLLKVTATPGLYSFQISGISPVEFLNVLFQITVTARDANGNILSGFSGSVALSDTTGIIQPTELKLINGTGSTDVLITQEASSVKILVSAFGETYSSTSFDVVDYEPLEADFSADPLSGTSPLTVEFADLSSGDVTAWEWNFGDGKTSTLQNPTNTYSADGSYTVTLKVTDTTDATDSVTKPDSITVAPLQLNNTYPTDGDWGVSLLPTIELAFNMSVDITDVTAVAVYTNEFGNLREIYGPVSSTGLDDSTFQFELSQALPRGTEINVRVENVKAKYGDGVLPEISFSFFTFPEISMKVIQVLEDMEDYLLAGKPTLVRVSIGRFKPRDDSNNIPGKVRLQINSGADYQQIGEPIAALLNPLLILDENEKFAEKKKGSNTVNFFLSGDANLNLAQAYGVRAIVETDDPEVSVRAESYNFAEKWVTTHLPGRLMRVEYIALNHGAWGHMDPTELSDYYETAEENSSFVEAVYPVSDINYSSVIAGSQVLTSAGIKFQVALWQLHMRALVSRRIDKVVGIVPPKYLGGASGISIRNWDGVLIDANPKNTEAPAAHELMHSYGYYAPEEEEYVRYKPFGRLASDGWWVAKGAEGARINFNRDRHNSSDFVKTEFFYNGVRSFSAFSGEHYFSFMSWANHPSWARADDYRTLFTRFQTNPLALQSASRRSLNVASVKSGDLRLLSGLILREGSLNLSPILAGDTLDEESSEPADPGYYVDFFSDTARLKRYGFNGITFPEESEVEAAFVFTVRMPAAANRIEIRRANETLLGTLAPSANLPTVRLAYPNGDESLPGDVTVRWDASDPDNDPLSFALYYSVDGGQTWNLLDLDIQQTSYEWRASGFPGSESCLLKIIVSDGFNCAEDVSDAVFSMADKPPISFIHSPENQTVFGFGQEVILEGGMHDPQGAPVDGQRIIWSSNLDGDIGNGENLTLNSLSMGTHTITVRATNEAGLTGHSEPLEIVIQSNQPPQAFASVSGLSLVNEAISFECYGQDPDGTIVLYEWDFDSDGVFDWSSTSSGKTVHTYTTVGDHPIACRVTDNSGDTDTDIASIQTTGPTSISGRVILDGIGLSGTPVIVNGGGVPQTVYSDFDGHYSIENLPETAYDVRPSFRGYSFSPDSIEVFPEGDGLVGQDFTANADPHILKMIKNGNGSVVSDPAGIDCEDDCSQEFEDGTLVRLSAVPDPGWGFAGWSGSGCSGNEDCVLSVDMDLTVTATFTTNRVESWTRLLGSWRDEEGTGIAVDEDGAYYVTGISKGHLDGNTTNANDGSEDVLVAKFDSFGNRLWARLLGSLGEERGMDIAVDARGACYITGYTNGDLDGNPNIGQEDVFTAKFDKHGNKQWVRLLGTPGVDRAHGIGVDSQGNSYITGVTDGNLDGQTIAGSTDVFVTKYDVDGNRQWTRLLGAEDGANAYDVAVDPVGNSFITGSIGQVEDFFGIVFANTDALLAKFDPNGNLEWLHRFGTAWDETGVAGTEVGFGIALDQKGFLYVTGETNSDLDDNTNAGRKDAMIARFDAVGDPQWTRLLGTSNDDSGLDIGVNSTGESYIIGFTTEFDPYRVQPFTTKYDQDGNQQWTHFDQVVYRDIAVSPEDLFTLVGNTNENLDGQPNAGNDDLFIWKMVDNPSVPEPPLFVDPTLFSFGNQAVGGFSSPLSISLANMGPEDLEIIDVSLSDSTNFVLDRNGGPDPLGDFPDLLSPAETRTVTVVFNPSNVSVFYTDLKIQCNSPEIPIVIVSLAGRGYPGASANLTVTPGTYDFGNVELATSSSEMIFTISNTGGLNLEVDSVYLNGPDSASFQVRRDDCLNNPVTPSGTCSLEVVFSPVAPGPKTVDLVVASNDPNHPLFTIPLTGYGTQDQATPLPSGLIHQYTFDEGQGTTVEDSVGNADAVVKGEGYAWSSGILTLPGGPSTFAAYVDLPNGILSSLESATIEAWLTVNAPSFYARILDFGSSTAGELEGPGGDGAGVDYLVLTASIGEDINWQRLAVVEADNARNLFIDGNGTTILGEPFQMALVIDKEAGQMRYFRDGEMLAVLQTDVTLAEINDLNNWLGRSNWTGEPNFSGSYLEFRIYDRALNDEEVSNSFAAGSDAGGSGGGTATQPPQITVQPQSLTVTAGEAAEFQVTADGANPLSYQWRRNGLPITGATSASLQLPSVSTDNVGEYTVLVRNTAGQVESQPAVLTVQPQPSDGPFALRNLPSNYFGGSPMSVRIEVNPPEQATAYVLEDQPPPGWTVDTIDSGGIYDTLNRKIKWIFLDNQARSLSYQVTPPQNAQGTVTFSGLVSFAGAEDQAIEGDLSLTTAATTGPPQISIAIDASGNIALTFEGVLHSASDVAGPYVEMPGAVSPLIVNPTPMSQFYRAVRQ